MPSTSGFISNKTSLAILIFALSFEDESANTLLTQKTKPFWEKLLHAHHINSGQLTDWKSITLCETYSLYCLLKLISVHKYVCID